MQLTALAAAYAIARKLKKPQMDLYPLLFLLLH